MGGGGPSRERQVDARNNSVTVTLRENLRHTCAARVLLILEVLGPSDGSEVQTDWPPQHTADS